MAIRRRRTAAAIQAGATGNVGTLATPAYLGDGLFWVQSTDLGEDRLGFGQGGQTITLTVPQWMLAQLILGYRSVADVLVESVTPVESEIVSILDVLFPVGHPYVWIADRF